MHVPVGGDSEGTCQQHRRECDRAPGNEAEFPRPPEARPEGCAHFACVCYILQLPDRQEGGVDIVRLCVDTEPVKANLEAQLAMIAEQDLLRQPMRCRYCGFRIERNVCQAVSVFVEDFNEAHRGSSLDSR